MKREFSVVIERDADGYFVGSVPTLKGCHTQAKSQLACKTLCDGTRREAEKSATCMCCTGG